MILQTFRITPFLLIVSILSYLIYSSDCIANSARIFKYKSASGTPTFSDIEPIGLHFQEIKVDCYACQRDSLINWHKAKLYLTEYSFTIEQAAKTNEIDPALVRAIIHAESHFNKHALSKQGAQGLMQLMPKTAKYLGVKNAFVAKQNIEGGTKHLAYLLKKYHGNIKLASAAYNAGESAVARFAGIPPFTETRVYVERVEILHKRYQLANKT